nr:hypothetical protein [Tanacetum cinerariifolium]
MANVEQGGADQQNASHEFGFVHEEEDAHVTLKTVHDKTEGPLQIYSVSSDFTRKLLNLDDPSSDINSLMDTLTVPPPPPPVNPSPHLTTITPQPTPDSTTTTTNPTMSLPNFLTLCPYSSLIKGCLLWKLKYSTMKAIIKEQVKAQLSKIMPHIEKNLYKALVKSYNTEKYILSSNGDVVTLKRGRDDQDKDKDPFVGSDRGRKRRKSSKDVEPSKGNELGHSDDQPNDETSPKNDWYKKHEKPPIPNHPWNKRKAIESRPPQTWISIIAKTRQPPRKFDELLSTPIDFSAYVMNDLKIDNLTQEILVGHAFNLLKGTCKSFAKLEYHFEECYKAVNDKLDWNNPEGHTYQFDLSKPLPLIEDRGRQVVYADYFINNDLEYLKGGSSSSKYSTSTTRTKAAKYDNIKGIEDMFKEGDFPRLNLRDIKDMLLLLVQKKLSNVDVDDRLMHSDELYKFHDETLSSVRSVLNDIASNLEMDYLPKRHWSNLEMKRSRIMVKAIDKLLFERRLMRNLEMFPEPEGSTQNIPLDSVVVLRKINTPAGNPVKEIILKLNLPDHRSILTDSKEYIKMDTELPGFSRLTRFIAT